MNLERLEDFAYAVALVLVDGPLIRRRAASGFFSLVEHAWHLADLECEGYGPRIDRLLSGEVNPYFADFRGDEIAKQRRYIEQDIAPAVARFVARRSANIAALRAATSDQLQLRGTQEGVGEVTLARIPEMMSEHDRGHAVEIADLLRELGLPVPPALTSFASEPPLRQTA
ncbi:MAG: DinB family protein [Thermoanaerobaculia bacterium]